MVDIDINKSKCAGDYVRYLALECIQRSSSGHPGLPLGCGDLGVILYRYILRYTPEDPTWMNRDRFILSAGHGSMFLYALTHMAGYDVPISDLSQFRQYMSSTPGHPEYEIEKGIETTTGPLGQGFANAVGVALEGKMLADRFNRDGFDLFDYNVYTLMGDGCTMEGVSYEAASLAGHLGLDNLIAIYDSNDISIDGSTEITLSENVPERYEALGWEVGECRGEDLQGLYRNFRTLGKKKGKPKMLLVRTTIGEGLNKLKGTARIHGSPAGIEEITWFLQNSSMREIVEAAYGKELVNDFERLKEFELQQIADKKDPLVSERDIAFLREAQQWNKPIHAEWRELLEKYSRAFPTEYALLQQYLEASVPAGLKAALLSFTEQKPNATRNSSGAVLQLCAEYMPQIIGGSADLACSTRATVPGSSYVEKGDFKGRNIPFGVREHAMGSIVNGLALNRTFIPFSATFLVFFDYMKPAVRLAALMQIRQLFVYTHDSIYVGEDGPTHEPIEHLNSLRLLPGMYTFRPANDYETAFSYLYFLEEMQGPAAILGSRQNMPATAYGNNRDRSALYEDFKKGAYIMHESENGATPDVVLAGSGSELGLAMDVAILLEQKGKNARVVSIPCLELFEQAEPAYRKTVLGEGLPLVLMETASFRGMGQFFQKNILLLDLHKFGISAPADQAAAHFGFSPDKIYERVDAFLSQQRNTI